MTKSKFAWLAATFLALFLSATAEDAPKAADETAKAAEDKDKDKEKDKDKDKPDSHEKVVVTTNSVVVGGQKIDYLARAGTLVLKNNEEKPAAAIFYVAYTRTNVADPKNRPITFSFNGGPGSSSVWLHLGLLGPRRVRLEDGGHPIAPPYSLVDNEYSLLDETDLVFIDPVSTGFSRAIKPDDAKNYHGLDEDIRSVADFIRLYLTRNGRWESPKFIIGESYGTTRAAGLSGELRGRHFINVNGIMLVSSVLNFQTLEFEEGNDLPYVVYLPSYTATAWYYKKLAPDLQARPLTNVLAEVEAFAAGDYNHALLLGDGLPAAERQSAISRYARLTGLSETFVERSNLRVPLGRFAVELLRDRNEVVGRFDSRYSGKVRDRIANEMPYDPSGTAVFGPFTSTFNQYVRAELKFEQDTPYEILTGKVHPWKWGSENSYVNVAGTLAESLTENPFLKVHVSCGYYDLATPYFAARYTFNHLGVDPSLLKNVILDDYTAGHMMYVNPVDLQKQKGDLARFIHTALGK
ncbi:MAG TPA: peptidase S10 [Candidatus Limnocylindria bacterium]|nr:peptidase S10 [Candidatus Limnocylindria bacterium]